MTGNEAFSNISRSMSALAERVGQFMRAAADLTVERGPEALETIVGLQLEVEHFELLEKEWAHHPLLDFIMWQEAGVGHTMAMTLPQRSIDGHAALARLLHPACTSSSVLDKVETAAFSVSSNDWAVDEFCHGLEHARQNELARAVTPLTVGLEGLIRISALARGLLTQEEIDSCDSGNRLVRRLWGGGRAYEAYMKSWVFGMANVYRHGDDRGFADEQALHAVCGSTIWASHILGDPTAFDLVRTELSREVREQYARGLLQIQPDAEARLRRAADAAEKSDYVRSLLDLRDQLRTLREQQRHAIAASSRMDSP